MKPKRRHLAGQGEGSSQPRPIKDSLNLVLRSLGSPPVDKLALLYDNWAEIAGEAIASATELGVLADGRLSVLVPDGGWASQLRWMEADLVAKISAFLGPNVVLGLDIRVRPR